MAREISQNLSDALVRPAAPALRNRDKEMIPRVLLRAMLALALSSLALVSFAVLTDRTHVGQPKPAEALASRQIVISGDGPEAVRITDPSGGVIADLDRGGFVAVVNNGLKRARFVQGVTGNPPVELVAYGNGRLTLSDPASGWSAELNSFGADNKAAFERLLTK